MRFRLVVNGEGHEVETDDGVTVDGRLLEGSAIEDARGITVHIGKKRYRLRISRWGSMVDSTPYRIEIQDLDPGRTPGGGDTGTAPADASVEVRPPMPGRIVHVAVKAGDRVARNAPLAVLEAMKMQNEIPAPVAGIVREVRVRVGQGVQASDVLVVLGPA